MRLADGEDAAAGRLNDALGLRQAVVLGLLQGPTELLPVSSSAHTTLLPWLARWPYAGMDGGRRKSFEVALHAGAAAALAVSMRRELLHEAAHIDPRRAGVMALAIAPPALAGYTLGGAIERRLGGARSIAIGLAVGAIAMAAADLRGGRGDGRTFAQAGARDGLALGLAQAAALMPGVSRNGATLTIARACGFERGAAQQLSWHAGLPVMLGASALRGWRLRRDGLAAGEPATLALGAGAAFFSTLTSARALGRRLSNGPSLPACALYRCALAALVISRLRDPDMR